MNDALDHLDLMFNTGRAPTQRKVYKSLLSGKIAAFEIAEDTKLSKNSVNVALHELVKSGVVERPLRARYYVNPVLLALHLYDRVKGLEERIVEKRGAQVKPSQAPRSTSRVASTPAPRGEPS